MSYAGIDYGLGQSNVDRKTGIRYGVISQHSVMPEALDDLEPYYGEPTCPKCGNGVMSTSDETILPAGYDEWSQYSEHGCTDYACTICEHYLDSSEVYAEESQGFTYEQDGYSLTNCLDSDIFILKSPYYTRAQFCSPCVPGAGNIDNPCDDGPKTYCLGHDWFENGKAPYPVFSVADNSEVSA